MKMHHDVDPFPKYTRGPLEKIQTVRILFQEIPDLDRLSIAEQKRYTKEVLEKLEFEFDVKKIFFELGKLYQLHHPHPPTYG